MLLFLLSVRWFVFFIFFGSMAMTLMTMTIIMTAPNFRVDYSWFLCGLFPWCVLSPCVFEFKVICLCIVCLDCVVQNRRCVALVVSLVTSLTIALVSFGDSSPLDLWRWRWLWQRRWLWRLPCAKFSCVFFVFSLWHRGVCLVRVFEFKVMICA